MTRARTPLEVLAQHQWPEGGEGGCTASDGWGLAVDAGDDDMQMAEHQIEKLAEAGFLIARAAPAPASVFTHLDGSPCDSERQLQISPDDDRWFVCDDHDRRTQRREA